MIVARVEEIYAPGSHGTNPITVPEEIGMVVFPNAQPSEMPERWQDALNVTYAAMGIEREPYVNGSGWIGDA